MKNLFFLALCLIMFSLGTSCVLQKDNGMSTNVMSSLLKRGMPNSPFPFTNIQKKLYLAMPMIGCVSTIKEITLFSLYCARLSLSLQTRIKLLPKQKQYEKDRYFSDGCVSHMYASFVFKR